MKTRIAIFVLVYVAAWWMFGWIFTEPARQSETLIARVAAATTFEEIRDETRKLTELYRQNPRQAYADWSRWTLHRTTIAVAAAPVPETRTLVEEALVTLTPSEKFFVALSAATDGNPTFKDGQWTGTDPVRLDKAWFPFLLARLDQESSPELVILYEEILRGSGWSPTPQELFRRAGDRNVPLDNRTASLIILARQPGGSDAIRGAMDSHLIPEDLGSRVLASRVLESDPASASWLVRFALDPANAVVSGGAFDVLVEVLGPQKERLWAVVSSVEAGNRAPLMRSLLSRGGWPAQYRRWFVGVWAEEARRGGAEFEASIADSGVSTLGAWVLEEKDEALRKELSLIHSRLRASRSR